MIIPGSPRLDSFNICVPERGSLGQRINTTITDLVYWQSPQGACKINWPGDIILVGKLAIRQPIEQLRHTCVCGAPKEPYTYIRIQTYLAVFSLLVQDPNGFSW